MSRTTSAARPRPRTGAAGCRSSTRSARGDRFHARTSNARGGEVAGHRPAHEPEPERSRQSAARSRRADSNVPASTSRRRRRSHAQARTDSSPTASPSRSYRTRPSSSAAISSSRPARRPSTSTASSSPTTSPSRPSRRCRTSRLPRGGRLRVRGRGQGQRVPHDLDDFPAYNAVYSRPSASRTRPGRPCRRASSDSRSRSRRWPESRADRMAASSRQRVAVVTGASRGLGARSRAPSQERARAWRWWPAGPRGSTRVEAGCRERWRRAARSFPADVSRVEVVRRWRGDVEASSGRRTCSSTRPGVFGPLRLIVDGDPRHWVETVMVNLVGPYLTCRAFVPGMIERGFGGSSTSLRPGRSIRPASSTAPT